MNALLEVNELSVAYGGIRALTSVSFNVKEGELVVLIGANGAGKSTTLKAITQSLAHTAKLNGTIYYQGKDISSLSIEKRVKEGIALVPEGRGIFNRMTVLENLTMGAYLREDKAKILTDIERGFAYFPRLKERSTQLAGTLSGGEQQMLAIARALMLEPKLLLLDEPSMGLSPILVEKVFEVVKDIAYQGTTVLLVEQNANLALSMAHRGYVLESGEITLEGDARTLREDHRVQEAYLGV